MLWTSATSPYYCRCRVLVKYAYSTHSNPTQHDSLLVTFEVWVSAKWKYHITTKFTPELTSPCFRRRRVTLSDLWTSHGLFTRLSVTISYAPAKVNYHDISFSSALWLRSRALWQPYLPHTVNLINDLFTPLQDLNHCMHLWTHRTRTPRLKKVAATNNLWLNNSIGLKKKLFFWLCKTPRLESIISLPSCTMFLISVVCRMDMQLSFLVGDKQQLPILINDDRR